MSKRKQSKSGSASSKRKPSQRSAAHARSEGPPPLSSLLGLAQGLMAMDPDEPIYTMDGADGAVVLRQRDVDQMLGTLDLVAGPAPEGDSNARLVEDLVESGFFMRSTPRVMLAGLQRYLESRGAALPDGAC